MTYTAKQFLDDFVRRHVSPVPGARRLPEAVRLANLCVEAASVCGLTEEHLEAEVGGELVTFIDARMQDATIEAWERSQAAG
jgi:hypothetical protein